MEEMCNSRKILRNLEDMTNLRNLEDMTNLRNLEDMTNLRNLEDFRKILPNLGEMLRCSGCCCQN